MLSLHPLCNRETYGPVAREYGFPIAEDLRIGERYPYCAFAVSFPCPTHFMAQMFGKPLIVYDFFDMARARNGESNQYPALVH